MNVEEIRKEVIKGIYDRSKTIHKNYLATWGYYESQEDKLQQEEEIFIKQVDKQYRQLPVMDIIHGNFNSVTKKKGKKTIFINENLPIIKVALQYELKVKGNKTPCPFHKDKDPSLVFYTETNSFHCFGCKASGDVITFIQMMEDIKNGR